MHWSKVTEQSRFILSKEENKRKRGHLEGEYGVWARHRLATADFYFIYYFFNIIINIF